MRAPPYVGRGIERSFSEPATLIRAGEGGRNEVGEWAAGVDEETDVRATVAPGVAAVQAAADSYYSKTTLDQSARNMTVNAPVTIHATTGADADEIARATTSAWQEAGRNMAEDNDSGRSE